jgi:hypothetical protein
VSDPWAAFPVAPPPAPPTPDAAPPTAAGIAPADPWASYPEAQHELTGMPSLIPSFARGAQTALDGGAQLLARGVEAVAPMFGQAAADWVTGQRQQTEAVNANNARDYAALKANDPVPGRGAAEFAGNVAATAPLAYAMPGAASTSLLPQTGAGALAGAATSALQPVDSTQGGDFWKQKGTQALEGGASGAATAGIFGALSKMAQPSKQVQTLMDAGVTLTPGQMSGGAVNRAEQGLTSVPVVGDKILNARYGAVQDFNRAAINKTLAPIGESLDSATPLGREAISEMADKVKTNYDKLIPQLSVKVDQTFGEKVQNLASLSQFLPPDRRDQFNKTLTGQVLNKFSPNGTMTGESFKEVESLLGQEARTYLHSSTGDEQKLGSAYLELQGQMRDLLERSNPARAGELQAANTAYANMLRVQGAAAATGSKEGVFTPAQLTSAVRQLDPSLRKSGFGRGTALMQDFAESGKTVMGGNVPDSGTAYRLTTAAGLLGGAGALDPHAAMAAGAAGAGLMGLYTRPGMKAASGVLANPALAGVLRNAAPGAAVMPGLLAPYFGNLQLGR